MLGGPQKSGALTPCCACGSGGGARAWRLRARVVAGATPVTCAPVPRALRCVDALPPCAVHVKVGGISTPELNRLELEMLKLLQFRLAVTPESLATQLAQLHSGSWVLDACSFPIDCAKGAGDVCMADDEARLFGRKRRSANSSACDADGRRLQRRSMEQVAA